MKEMQHLKKEKNLTHFATRHQANHWTLHGNAQMLILISNTLLHSVLKICIIAVKNIMTSKVSTTALIKISVWPDWKKERLAHSTSTQLLERLLLLFTIIQSITSVWLMFLTSNILRNILTNQRTHIDIYPANLRIKVSALWITIFQMLEIKVYTFKKHHSDTLKTDLFLKVSLLEKDFQ